MEKIEFNFDYSSFNKLFPFYILIDVNFQIKSYGISLSKMFPAVKENKSFFSIFNIERPRIQECTFENIKSLYGQMVFLKSEANEIILRGQFQELKGDFLFLGSPWFTSMEEVAQNKLTFSDFANHDPLLDMLHVLKSQEIVAEELNELLVTINEQKNKLKTDQEELNRLSLVASANQNGVVFTDRKGVIFWCNDAYSKLTGFSREEVIGSTPIQIGKCDETTAEELKKMTIPFMNGDPFDVEHLHRRKGGGGFWVKTKGQPIFNSDGELVQYFAMIEDISSKKHSDYNLKESEARLSSLIMNLQTGILLEDEKRQILLANKKFCAMFDSDVDPEELLGKDFSNTIEDSKHFFKDPDAYVEGLSKIFREKLPVYDEEIELVDGKIYERSYIPIFRDGIYKGNLRSYVDITVKKKHEQILQAEKEKYSSIIANMNLGLLEVDLNDVVTMANQSFCDISGYNLDEVIGHKSASLLLSAEEEKVVKAKSDSRIEGVSDSYEIKVNTKKGEKRHWLISGAPNYNLNGEVIGSIGINLDITGQKQQEEQLYLLSLIADKNINSVIISDKEGRMEWVNTSFLEMTGYSMDELIGKKPGNLLQGEESSLETANYLKERIKAGEPFNCEIINYSKSGEKYWVRIQGQALRNKKGEIIRFFAIEENITKKKLLEKQKEELVFKLEKQNEQLNDYAKIVSHDLKSPLRSIHSLITWIKEDNSKKFNSETEKYFNLIQNKVEKMDYLIDGVLTYSKIDSEEIQIEKVDVNELVLNIINIIHIPNHITVTINNHLPIISGDRFRMQQLFQNIISNAVNYIDKEVGLVEVDYKETADHYIFSIKDNGVGIDEKHYLKVFNTFQSYTDSAHSTGLGLSIVKKIVQKYKGEIWLESKLGKGSTFFIKLNK
ncbi:PAS domain S-box protein [Flavobacterium frigoris]|uniref:Sensory transduction histidine kinase n=1 Tax=Flavobacterium frigoris (strain PS1) TaxID=1086011 RepID=H7FP84_FLAFP|nr:PAS domain S-box protein [Flavobacterium frigoris]EIA09564.1 sensory transduction histidine kinase [Flavobacterium frigoris PS1]